MTKPHTESRKPAIQGGKPETKPQGAKPSVPGSESSKAQGGAKDVRSAHDKDGNSQQRGR